MTNKLCITLLAAALTCAASAACADVKIGFLGTLFGPAASLGQDHS
jgi:hypothetical protein